jgi:hypothetical protein
MVSVGCEMNDLLFRIGVLDIDHLLFRHSGFWKQDDLNLEGTIQPS